MTTNSGPLPGTPEPDMLRFAEIGEQMDLSESPFELFARERTIRASLLQQLLLGQLGPVHARGMRLRGVFISGQLDLAEASLRWPLHLTDCRLDGAGPVVLDRATVSLLTLNRCYVAGLEGNSLTVTKDLDLTGSTFADPLRLPKAHVAGSLICTSARLMAESGASAVAAAKLEVGQDVLLDGEFAANGGIDLVGAEIRGSLTCTGAQLAGSQGGNALTADRVRVGRNVSFDQALTQSGALRLAGASIAGRLDCRGAQLNGVDDDHRALVAQGMRIGDDMLLTKGFAARGGVDLVDAEIAGFLTCTGAQLAASGEGEGDALTAERIKVGKNASFEKALVQAGSLQLGGASIVGRLDCRGAQLNGVDEDGAALAAYRMKAGDDVLLADGFTSAGGINLIDAEITGSLTCTGAQLAASHDGSALAAKRIKARNVRLNGSNTAGVVRPFTAAGTIDLTSADISGELNCADAYLRGTDIPGDIKGYALYAKGAKVGDDVNLGQKSGKFTATGAIQLSGADIAGGLVLNNSFLIGTDGRDNALYADELKVHGNVDLMRIFAVGTVSLKSATVGGNLRLKPLKLAGSRHQVDKDKIAFDVSGAKIAQELEWEPEAPVHGRVNLEHATVGRLTDNWTGPRSKSGFWPQKARLSLDGLTYTTIGGDHSADLNHRLKWIRSQYPDPPAGTTRFAAQPYELLANFYKQTGQDSEAREVAVARRRDLRKHGRLAWYRKALNWLLDKTIQ